MAGPFHVTWRRAATGAPGQNWYFTFSMALRVGA